MTYVTLVKINNPDEEWGLHMNRKEVLFAKDTEEKYGGYWRMFDSLAHAEQCGWRLKEPDDYCEPPTYNGEVW